MTAILRFGSQRRATVPFTRRSVVFLIPAVLIGFACSTSTAPAAPEPSQGPTPEATSPASGEPVSSPGPDASSPPSRPPAAAPDPTPLTASRSEAAPAEATEPASPPGPEASQPSSTPGATPVAAAKNEPAPYEAGDGEAADPISAIFRELNPAGPKQVDFTEFRQLLPRDAIRPVYSPEYSSPEKAALAPKDLVIGVSVAGEHRAYPIKPLAFREMVNDVLGGSPILVTW